MSVVNAPSESASLVHADNFLEGLEGRNSHAPAHICGENDNIYYVKISLVKI